MRAVSLRESADAAFGRLVIMSILLTRLKNVVLAFNCVGWGEQVCARTRAPRP